MRKFITPFLLAGGLALSGPALAWECPKHFAEAEAAISKASDALSMAKGGDNTALAHTLRDDANMLLASAKHNHEKPAAGLYDHARAIAKAKSAKAYAETAADMASR
ncbi:MAG: hypothetical protein R3298_13085 [Gammaproteobacteria bacterium]|nr:hypothetical protein [Gammaproteobacteria bacterium]